MYNKYLDIFIEVADTGSFANYNATQIDIAVDW